MSTGSVHAGRLSVILIYIPDTVVKTYESDVRSFHCFRWILGVPSWNDLTLSWKYFSLNDLTPSWRYFFTRLKFFTCYGFWKEISVSLVSSWSFVGVVLLCTALLPVVVVVGVVVLRLVLLSYIVLLILCPLQGLERGFEVLLLLWKWVFLFSQ